MRPELFSPIEHKNTILVVEDDLSFIDQIPFYIQSKDYKLIFAEDGYKALNILKNLRIDLAIISTCLPSDMQGINVLSNIKSSPELSEIECIMLSIDRDPMMSDECARIGAYCYLVKCHETLERLEMLINRVLDN